MWLSCNREGWVVGVGSMLFDDRGDRVLEGGGGGSMLLDDRRDTVLEGGGVMVFGGGGGITDLGEGGDRTLFADGSSTIFFGATSPAIANSNCCNKWYE